MPVGVLGGVQRGPAGLLKACLLVAFDDLERRLGVAGERGELLDEQSLALAVLADLPGQPLAVLGHAVLGGAVVRLGLAALARAGQLFDQASVLSVPIAV